MSPNSRTGRTGCVGKSASTTADMAFGSMKRSYQWLRGWVPPEAVREELNALVAYVRDTQGHKKTIQNVEYNIVDGGGHSDQPRRESGWRVLLEPEVQAAFRIVVIYFFVSPFAALFGMRAFFIEILNSLDTPVDAHSVVAACGVLTMLGAITTGVLVRSLGKRKLTFLSMSTCVGCCATLGYYFLADLRHPWVAVVVFCVSYYFGALVIQLPWIVLIELFPLRARSIGSGFCAAFAYVAYFIVTKTYYSMAAWFGVSGTCFLYGLVGLLGLVYLYYDLPETEGRTLVDIERRLSERTSSKRKSIVKYVNKEQTKEEQISLQIT